MIRSPLLALLVAWPVAAVAAPLPVQVRLEPRVITVGDRVRAELTLIWDGAEPTGLPHFPAWQGRWGEAEVLATSPVEALPERGGRRIYAQSLTLTAFQTGDFELPPVTVEVPVDAGMVAVPTAAGAGFTVRSLLPDRRAAEIPPRPPAALRELPPGWRFLATTGVLATLCLGTAVLVVRRQRRMVAPEMTLIPPLDELLARLRALDPGLGSEPAHTGLSLALRIFLGRTLELNAVEATTSEIERRLAASRAPAAPGTEAVALLRACDLVKFARCQVTGAETGQRLRAARRLARAIDAELRPAGAEEDG